MDSVDPGDRCQGDETRCIDGTYQVCNAGVFETQETCAASCSTNIGCTVCEANTATCDDGVSVVCKPDGSGFIEEVCDAFQELSCNETTGFCEGTCAAKELGPSYIGCDYYPTVTANLVSTDFEFAVVVSNTSTEPANIIIDEGPLPSPIEFTVPPGDVVVQRLPWNFDLKMCNNAAGCTGPQGDAALSRGGAFHLRASQPVTVYQFSPVDFTNGVKLSDSNDASLLLPRTAWGEDYLAATWPKEDVSIGQTFTFPPFIAITASQDDTEVSLITTAATRAGGGAPAFEAGQAQSITLQRGDVLEVMAFGQLGDGAGEDLTGSQISANKPIQVISGSYCAFVPDFVVSGACDHLEESVFPTATLSRDYVIAPPKVVAIPNGKENVVRIIATEPDTTLTYDPPIAGAATTIRDVGAFVEISREDRNFAINADKRVMVVQYMEGKKAGGNEGDPAMAMVVATDQYRKDYLFHAPTNYLTNYVNVVARMGTTVTLDGVAVANFTAIGESGFGIARVSLDNTGTGNHIAESDQPFGISVYGYGDNTSYWYPGGLDLDIILVE